jgi:hypothetical protein
MGIEPITSKVRHHWGGLTGKTRLALLVLCVVLLAACTAAQPAAVDSGVKGLVTIGPMCPVARIDQPCPDQPFQATLTVLDQAGKKVAQVQSDANGLYQLALKPGEYSMHPESPNGMQHAQDQLFTVLEGQFTKLDIVYDSGIR